MKLEFLNRFRTLSVVEPILILRFIASVDNSITINFNYSDKIFLTINNGQPITLTNKPTSFKSGDSIEIYSVNYNGCNCTYEKTLDVVDFIYVVNIIYPQIVDLKEVKTVKEISFDKQSQLFLISDTLEYIGVGNAKNVDLVRCFECPNLTYIGLTEINDSFTIDKTNIKDDALKTLISNLGKAKDSDTKISFNRSQYTSLDSSYIDLLKSKNWNMEII